MNKGRGGRRCAPRRPWPLPIAMQVYARDRTDDVFPLVILVPTRKWKAGPASLAHSSFALFPWRIVIHCAPSAELTMARIAALSGAGSLDQAPTTDSRPSNAMPVFCEAICEALSDFPNESAVFCRFKPCSAHHFLREPCQKSTLQPEFSSKEASVVAARRFPDQPQAFQGEIRVHRGNFRQPGRHQLRVTAGGHDRQLPGL